MNLHQFRFVREAVRQNLNLTAAAKALYTSQPGISKSIIELEEELGILIFTRHGKRLKDITEQGKVVVAAAERILREVEALKRVGADYVTQDQGELIIAATPTYARYLLPSAIARFRPRFPKVLVSILQGSSSQVSAMISSGEADLVLTPGDLSGDDTLLTLPCANSRPVAVVPVDHPLAGRARLESDDLARFPLIVDDDTFGQQEMFRQGNRMHNVALRAADAEMVKTYVALGLGIGIVEEMAFDTERDRGLCVLPFDHVSDSRTAYVAFRRDAFVRSCVHTLVELLSPTSSLEHVEQAMRNTAANVTDLAANNVTPLRRPLRPVPAPGRKKPVYSVTATAF
ncbi:HTH-type transcriptional regulator CysB [Pararobbsia alpina]|uniref:HTH-type transcriptional regulator CysB n=1 Tax=Pararobbsia alpina TaxID=621374 RepID=A0A6S7B196_9BURK|nr:HTH-type transcriptional regulator CysB [Pararobbsia alpina]